MGAPSRRAMGCATFAAWLAACEASPPPPTYPTTTACSWPDVPNDPFAAGAMKPVPIEYPDPNRPVPSRAGRSKDFVDIGVGAAKVCGLRDDGTAQCFAAGSEKPEAVELPWQGIRKLVLGEAATCALLDDGTARCDVEMPELGEVVSLAVGRDEHCAASPRGVLRCWQANRPDTVRQVLIPMRAVAVDSAFSHTCAINEGGDLFCWGDNASGQLGVASPARSDSPVLVPNVGHVVEVATGGDHTCSRDGGGRVTCWGAGHYGQAGDGSADPRETQRRFVPGVVAERLVAGAHHSCALDREGRVTCWGWNHWEQMGPGRADVRLPAPVAGLPRASRIGAHGAVTCALVEPHRIACLGGYTPTHFGPWRLPLP